MSNQGSEPETDDQKPANQAMRLRSEQHVSTNCQTCNRDEGDPHKFLTSVLLIGTLIATIYAAYCTGEYVVIAKDQERRSLRAYALVSAKTLENFSKGGVAAVQAKLDNAGQTPIYDGVLLSGINVLPYPLNSAAIKKTECSFIEAESQKRWFFGKTSYPYKERNTSFTQDELARIKAGTAAIYYAGRFCYKDIFNDFHYTDFCIQWRGKGDGLEDAEYCDYGNESDH